MRVPTVLMLVLANMPIPDERWEPIPDRTRNALEHQLDALAHCTPVDAPGLHMRCVRQQDGTMHHTVSWPDGGVGVELFIAPNFDGVVKMHPMPGGSYLREERFTWNHAPTRYVEEGRVLLRWHRMTYAQVSADGHFEQRRIESKWPWQGQAHVREESDPLHNGHWRLVREERVPEPLRREHF